MKTVILKPKNETFLLNNYKNANLGGNFSIAAYRSIYQIIVSDLKNIFTYDEFFPIIDSLNGTIIEPTLWISNRLIIAHLQDSQKYDNTLDKYKLNQPDFFKKLKDLNNIQLWILTDFCKNFWNNPKNILEDYLK